MLNRQKTLILLIYLLLLMCVRFLAFCVIYEIVVKNSAFRFTLLLAFLEEKEIKYSNSAAILKTSHVNWRH